MDTLELILAELQKTPNISVVNTSLHGQNATFTIYQIMPCSSDIYAVFIDPATNALYALQNTGASFWMRWNDDSGNEKYFLLPVTSYLIKDRENCLFTFYKWCRQSDLGDTPIVKEDYVNPFLPN